MAIYLGGNRPPVGLLHRHLQTVSGVIELENAILQVR